VMRDALGGFLVLFEWQDLEVYLSVIEGMVVVVEKREADPWKPQLALLQFG